MLTAQQPHTLPAAPLLARPWATATVLGLLHAIVDMVSIAVVFAQAPLGGVSREHIVLWTLIYNVTAFGLQGPLGLIADRLRAYRLATVAGLLLTAVAAAGVMWGETAILVVAVGNALFHVGGGAITLRASGGRANLPGLFVGPGAMGVAMGVWLGANAFPMRWAIAAVLGVIAIVLTRVRLAPEFLGDERDLKQSAGSARGLPLGEVHSGPVANAARGRTRFLLSVALIVLLISTLIRATAGGVLRGQWHQQTDAIALALGAAAAMGKILGGFAADRIGWRVWSVGILLVAAGTLWQVSSSPAMLLTQTLLAQSAMAVTLAALFRTLPGRPGLSFGLLSTALLLGAPNVYGYGRFIHIDWTPWLWALLSASAILVWAGLTLLVRQGAAGLPQRRNRD